MRILPTSIAAITLWAVLAISCPPASDALLDPHKVAAELYGNKREVANVNAVGEHRVRRRGFEAINTLEPYANSSNYFAELSRPAYGLFIWTNLARLTRVNLRNGKKLPIPNITSEVSTSPGAPEGAKTIVLHWDQEQTKSYFIPMAIFLAAILLTFLSTCCSCCCICCCKRKRLGRSQKDPYSGRQKFAAGFGLALITLAWMAAIAGGISGAHFFGRSVYILSDTVDQTFLDVQLTATNMSAAVNTTLDTIQTGTVKQIRTALDTWISKDKLPPIQSKVSTMVGVCQTMGNKVTELINLSGDLINSKVNIARSGSGLVAMGQSNLVSNNAEATKLTTDRTTTVNGNTYTYRWSAPPPPKPNTATLSVPRQNVENLANLTFILQNDISSILDVSAIAAAAQAAAGNLTGTVTELENKGIDTVDTTLRTQVNGQYRDDITKIILDFNTTIGDTQSDTKEYTSYSTKYELYRMLFFAVLFSLPGVILLFVLAGVGAKKPGMVRCCLCGSIPYTLLALILTLLLFLLTVILGETCTLMFDRSDNGTAPIASVLATVSEDASTYFTKGMAARDSCIAQKPFLSIIAAVLPADALDFDIADLSTKLGEVVDDQDFSAATNSINYEQMIGSTTDPSGAPVFAQGLGLRVTSYDPGNYIGALKTSLTALLPSIDAIIQSLKGAGPDDADHFGTLQDSDLTSDAPVGSADRVAVLQKLQSDLTSVRRAYQIIKRDQVQAAIDALSSMETLKGTTMPTKSGEIFNAANQIPPAFNSMNTTLSTFFTDVKSNVTNGIPILKSSIKAVLSGAVDANLNTGFRCDKIAKDTVDLEMGICDGILTGFDAIWFAFFIFGSAGALTIPVFISAANRLADRNAAKPKGAASKKVFKTGKSKEAEDRAKAKQKGKGKVVDDMEVGQIKWTVATPGSETSANIEKTALLLPTSATGGNIPSPQSMYPDAVPHQYGGPDAGFQYQNPHPPVDPNQPPQYDSRPQHTRASSISKHSQQHGSYQPSHRNSHIPQSPNVFMDDGPEMRPSWLGPAGAGGGAAFSGNGGPSDDSYTDEAAGYQAPQYPPQNHGPDYSRRISAVPHPQEYENVVDEFSRRVSSQAPPNPNRQSQQPGQYQAQYGEYNPGWDQ